jgi:hypothetical protein
VRDAVGRREGRQRARLGLAGRPHRPGLETAPVTVHYATANGTASADSDYEHQIRPTLTFDPGDTAKTIAIPITEDVDAGGT